MHPYWDPGSTRSQQRSPFNRFQDGDGTPEDPDEWTLRGESGVLSLYLYIKEFVDFNNDSEKFSDRNRIISSFYSKVHADLKMRATRLSDTVHY